MHYEKMLSNSIHHALYPSGKFANKHLAIEIKLTHEVANIKEL